MTCPCAVPSVDLDHPNPHKRRTCVVCGYPVPPEWYAIEPFLDHLEASFADPSAFLPLRELCEARERRGRGYFGLRFLGKDNVEDAMEEASDFINYCAFEALRARREGNAAADTEVLALTAARKAAEAYAALLTLRRKRNGAP